MLPPATAPGTPIPPRAVTRFPRRPPSSRRRTPSPPRQWWWWWWYYYYYYYFAGNIRVAPSTFPPFLSFASRFIFQPGKSPSRPPRHTPSRRARFPPSLALPRAAAPRCSGAGNRRRPNLPAGSPLPRAEKCRKSSPSPPALSPGLDRSRRSPATGCKTHPPFRGCTGDGITIMMVY